jgi:uncharacterized protein
MDLNSFAGKARSISAENKKFLSQLKRKKTHQLDYIFQDAHEEAFEKIDCLTCANCCKTTSPIFYQKDIDRLAKRLRMHPNDFIEKYLRIDGDEDYVLTSAPCAFLGDDNYCSVYEDRPTACRDYPHTDRKNMHQLLDLTYKNTLVCPAVLQIVATVKKKLENPGK